MGIIIKVGHLVNNLLMNELNVFFLSFSAFHKEAQ